MITFLYEECDIVCLTDSTTGRHKTWVALFDEITYWNTPIQESCHIAANIQRGYNLISYMVEDVGQDSYYHE